MFFAHIWLGFILIAFLISPACAMPRPGPHAIEYEVSTYDKNGRAQMKDTGLKHIEYQYPPRSDIQFDSSTVLYFRLRGGNFCDPPPPDPIRICYGYVVTSPALNIMFGSLVAAMRLSIVGEIHLPLPPSLHPETESQAKGILNQEYLSFLMEFEPVRDWVEYMHQCLEETSDAVAKASNTVKQAMRLLKGQHPPNVWLCG
ncbi:hypothetical protein BDP27DRAFT_1322112 [Rhodocollybia butyracea]|uniref:Uncharacterized protein n=1 Tax=Rhodocollybia butyracea TaxID=206335 RepID=A0A9P5PY65_9AGAR|nr:hypothetical protein BDP27DRAFT_1322112 [Rhodocollybia butyracea]